MRALLVFVLALFALPALADEPLCAPIMNKLTTGYYDSAYPYPLPKPSFATPFSAVGDGAPRIWGAQFAGMCGSNASCVQCLPGTPNCNVSNTAAYTCPYAVNTSPPHSCSSPFWDTAWPNIACAEGYSEIASGPNVGKCYSKNESLLDQLNGDLGSTYVRSSDGNLTDLTDSRAQHWSVTSFDAQNRPITWINPDGTTSTVTYFPNSNKIWSREAGGIKIFPIVTPGIRGRAEQVRTDGVFLEDGLWKQAAAASTMVLVRDATQLVPSPQLKLIAASGATGLQVGTQAYGLLEPILSRGVDGLCAVPLDSGLDAETPHDREQRCNAQYNRDEAICGVFIANNYTKPGGTPYTNDVVLWNLHRYTVCKASAIRRLGQCLSGETLEELELIHQGAPGH